MPVILKNLVPGSILTNAAVTYYQAPGGIAARINNATVTNFSGAPADVTVSIGANGNATQKMLQHTVQAKETYTCPELVGANIESGGILQALASANGALNFMVSGLEQF